MFVRPTISFAHSCCTCWSFSRAQRVVPVRHPTAYTSTGIAVQRLHLRAPPQQQRWGINLYDYPHSFSGFLVLNMAPFISLARAPRVSRTERVATLSRASRNHPIVACTSSPNKDSTQHTDIIDGGNFVIKKFYTIHGPSFVMVRRAVGDLPIRRPQRRSGSLVPYQRSPPSLSSDLHVSDLLRQPVDITKFSVLLDDATNVVLEIPEDAVEVLHDDNDNAAASASECTGIVWVGSADNTAHQVCTNTSSACDHVVSCCM